MTQEKSQVTCMDDLLGFGRFQHFQIWVLQTLLAIYGAFDFLHMYFIVSDASEWNCEDSSYEKCDVDGTVCGGTKVLYNTTDENYLFSINIQYDWVCDKSLRGASVITATVVGSLINTLIFGQLGDVLGRVKVVYITNVTFIVFRVASFYVTDYYYLFLFLSAAATSFFPVGVRVGYTLVAEYCDETGRRYAFISGWVWWVFGGCMLPFIAMWLNDWYVFGMITTLLNIVLFVLYPWVPESPRFLITKKDYEGAAKVIATIRKTNRDPEIENLEEVLKNMNEGEEGDTDLGIISLVKDKSLRKLFISMAVLYVVNDFFYFAGQLNSANLAGNMFVNFSLLSLTELPSVFIGQYCIDRFGRRWSHLFFMAGATAMFLVNVIIVNQPGTDYTVLVMSLLAKGLGNICWFVMWVQSIEAFPTCVRNSGINLCTCLSILVSMAAPFFLKLGEINQILPYAGFVLLGFMGMVAAFLVPETKGTTLPESGEQLAALYRHMKLFELRPWNRPMAAKQEKCVDTKS